MNTPQASQPQSAFDMHALKQQLEQDQAEQKSLHLTLGVEFECILAHSRYPSSGSRSIKAYGDVGTDMIRDVLGQPIRAKCSTCGKQLNFDLPLEARLRRTGYNHWSVDADSSIRLMKSEEDSLGNDLHHFDFYSIEFKSRILEADKPLTTKRSRSDPNHIHCVSYAEEISAVLRHLNNTFNSSDPESRYSKRCSLFTNKSCGMHVHIGNSQSGFPLHTVKNTMTTYIACERAIDAIQASDRIGGASSLLADPRQALANVDFRNCECFAPGDNAYNRPLSASHGAVVYRFDANSWHCRGNYPYSQVADPAVARAVKQYSPAANITLIQRAPTLQALKFLQNGSGHSTTVNLENLIEFGSSNEFYKKTIEFRQHAASLDPEQVTAWAELLVKLVKHAHTTPSADFAALVNGCSSETVSHYKDRLGIRCANGMDYVNQLWQRESQRIQALPAEDISAPLLLQNLKDRLETWDNDNIAQRISTKLLNCGYGQFPDSYVDQLNLQFDVGQPRDRLRVGWMTAEQTATAGERGPYGVATARSIYAMLGPDSQVSETTDERSAPSADEDKWRESQQREHTDSEYEDADEASDEPADETSSPQVPAQPWSALNENDADTTGIHPDRLRMLQSADAGGDDTVSSVDDYDAYDDASFDSGSAILPPNIAGQPQPAPVMSGQQSLLLQPHLDDGGNTGESITPHVSADASPLAGLGLEHSVW